MRIAAVLLAGVVLAAEGASPVVGALLRSLTEAQAAALGPAPSLEVVAQAVPADRRQAVAASLAPLEAGATPARLAELSRAYFLLSQPGEGRRVSRLASAGMSRVDGLAFEAWAALQEGDSAGAASAAREALRRAPGRQDVLAILKLTEGRGPVRRDNVAVRPPTSARHELVPAAVVSAQGSEALAREQQVRTALRYIAEAGRARGLGDGDRALAFARRAVAADPGSRGPREFLQLLEAAPSVERVRDGGDAEAAVQEALDTMKLSPVGKKISDAMNDAGVFIRVDDALPLGSLAAYNPRQNTIFVPRDFGSHPLIVRAIIAAHEGYHAVQNKGFGSAVTLETEKDATLRSFAVYHELRRAGLDDIPATHELKANAMAFEDAVSNGAVRDFLRLIEAQYRGNARFRKDEFMKTLPRPLQRAAQPLIDGLPAYHNATPAADLKANIWGRLFAGREKLEVSQLRHAEEIRWFEKWRKARN